MSKGEKYSFEERVALVKACIARGYNSTPEASSWLSDGAEALKDRRGRHRKDHEPQTEERLKLEIAALKQPLYLAQMENDAPKIAGAGEEDR